MIDYKIYLESLKGQFFKILPLYENEQSTLSIHLQSVKEEVLGFAKNDDVCECSREIISLINILNFLITEEYDQKSCKRNVFKCIKTIEIIEKKCGE